MPFTKSLETFSKYKPTLIGAYFLDRGYHVEFYWLTELDHLLCDWQPVSPSKKDLKAFKADGSYYRMLSAGQKAAALNGYLPTRAQ